MFSFINRSFSTCPPLYPTAVLSPLLQSLYIKYMSLISSPEDFGVLEMFSLEGLIGQCMYLPSHKIHSSFVFVAQVLVQYGYEESMAPVFSVPSVIS